jgi:type VI protein secretion system component VasF
MKRVQLADERQQDEVTGPAAFDSVGKGARQMSNHPPLNGIDQAIQKNEAFIAWLDHRAARVSMKVTCATSRQWRERWLAALGTLSQRLENAQHLLSGLKAIRHRPELGERRGRMLKFGAAASRARRVG